MIQPLHSGYTPKRTESRRHTDGQHIHEKVLNVTIIREIQIKTTMRYHLIALEWLFSRRQGITSVGENVEKREPSCTVGGNIN